MISRFKKITGRLSLLLALGFLGPQAVKAEENDSGERAQLVKKADFHVSPTGNDAWAGTPEKPFRSLARARDAVRDLKKSKTDDIHVWLRGGNYPLR